MYGCFSLLLEVGDTCITDGNQPYFFVIMMQLVNVAHTESMWNKQIKIRLLCNCSAYTLLETTPLFFPLFPQNIQSPLQKLPTFISLSITLQSDVHNPSSPLRSGARRFCRRGCVPSFRCKAPSITHNH